jgi:hypothetical protein
VQHDIDALLREFNLPAATLIGMVGSRLGSQEHSQRTTGQTPRYTAFDSTTVLLCGFSSDAAKELSKQIETAGGRVINRLSQRGTLPAIIVCGNVGDKVYKVMMHSTCLTAAA